VAKRSFVHELVVEHFVFIRRRFSTGSGSGGRDGITEGDKNQRFFHLFHKNQNQTGNNFHWIGC